MTELCDNYERHERSTSMRLSSSTVVKGGLDETSTEQQPQLVRLAWRLRLKVEGWAFSDAGVINAACHVGGL